jgi:transcriptional regulator with XRE-family HTH domain
MTSLFWSNLEAARIKAKKGRKDIETECNLANNAFTQGIKRKSSPSVDLAYRLAQTVNTTIEELVAGDEGAGYVQRVIRNDARAIQVPDRIYPIVKNLLLLDDRDLTGIMANAEALAAAKEVDKKGVPRRTIGEATGTDG